MKETASQLFANRIKTINIDHEKVKNLYSVLDSLLTHRNKLKGKSKHLFVIGESNSGKTIMAENYLERYPGYTKVDEEGTEIDIKPVIFLEAPHPFTLLEFYNSIIEALGAPQLAGRPTIGDVKNRALYLLNKQEVKMVIIDEIHNIMDSRAVTNKEAMTNIKHISNKSDVSMVLLGIPSSKELRIIDDQIKARFRLKSLDIYKECDQKFYDLLKSIEDFIKPPEPIGLGNPKIGLPDLLHFQSKGRIGWLVPIIQEAYNLLGVLDDDFNDLSKAQLTVESLVQAYDNLLGDLDDE